ncbi:MAG: hypothetical protein CMG13_02505 [Candidatus Marinimicrobia bacterium]|nr:hypothetical protein [Candidatus Neomarinimicrobiota bacterium]
MKAKFFIKSCINCDKAYKLDPQKYFFKYCNYCQCEDQEVRQQEIELKIKDHMILKYGGIDVKV